MTLLITHMLSYVLLALSSGSPLHLCYMAADSASSHESQSIIMKVPPAKRKVEKRSESSASKQHVLWPKECIDKNTNAKTYSSLKEVIKHEDIYSYTDN